MAGAAHLVIRLLLFSLITTGVNGEDGLIAEQNYQSSSPCEEGLVCFPVRQLSSSHTSDYFAIVSDGGIKTATSEDSKCTLQITAEDVGLHRCQQLPEVFSPLNTIPELILMPGKTVLLRCIYFTYIEQWHCYTHQRKVRLTWVDESGAEIQEDSEQPIKRKSSCDITLTVTLQSPGNKKFRCTAFVNGQAQTSVELGVRVPAPKGRGRGLVIDLEPENQGGNQNTIGLAVGVVGCAVLTALVSLFVVNRRRTMGRQVDESCYTISANNVVNADDVIYADIILPVSPDRLQQIHDCDSTVYACVRYK
ncbi:hypothetical protein CgunFtcFv8_007516 [Champsocephalus gunnari]|uniref:Ig-like domain-containing protein n=1 Tax=Champsocephalus gunnari TaxID=52237 RepID=A0AAN8CHC2_CHAGU|nr:hypothetical protein CgunFtcFv8_007516 [Champsocephalus gunnari]